PAGAGRAGEVHLRDQAPVADAGAGAAGGQAVGEAADGDEAHGPAVAQAVQRIGAGAEADGVGGGDLVEVGLEQEVSAGEGGGGVGEHGAGPPGIVEGLARGGGLRTGRDRGKRQDRQPSLETPTHGDSFSMGGGVVLSKNHFRWIAPYHFRGAATRSSTRCTG